MTLQRKHFTLAMTIIGSLTVAACGVKTAKDITEETRLIAGSLDARKAVLDRRENTLKMQQKSLLRKEKNLLRLNQPNKDRRLSVVIKTNNGYECYGLVLATNVSSTANQIHLLEPIETPLSLEQHLVAADQPSGLLTVKQDCPADVVLAPENTLP